MPSVALTPWCADLDSGLAERLVWLHSRNGEWCTPAERPRFIWRLEDAHGLGCGADLDEHDRYNPHPHRWPGPVQDGIHPRLWARVWPRARFGFVSYEVMVGYLGWDFLDYVAHLGHLQGKVYTDPDWMLVGREQLVFMGGRLVAEFAPDEQPPFLPH